jgi:hypothetical protein
MHPNYSILSFTLSAAATLAFALPATAQEAAPAATNPPTQVASLDPSTVPPPPGAQTPVPAAAAPPPSADTAAPASANPPPSPARTMDNTLSAFAVFGYGYSGLGAAPGVGVRFQKRIVSDVALKGPKVHDDIAIEAGLDYVHYSWSVPAYPQYNWSYNEFSIVAGVVYNFWLTDSLTLYPKIELAYGFGHTSSYSGIESPNYGGVWFQGAAGAAYKFGPVSLRGEFGWRAVRLGAGFTF